jgi:hypothetical protein
MTMEKCKTGPWYSEAIIYHYHDIDDSAESRCYKTRLTHLYYDNKLRKQSSLNVKHLDHILYDRNWQRKSLQRGLLLIQNALQETQTEKEKAELKQKNQAAIKTIEEAEKTDPRNATRQSYIKTLTEEAQTRLPKEAQYRRSSYPGSINTEEENLETLTERKQLLEQQQEDSSDPEEIENLQIQLDETVQKIAVLKITKAKEKTEGKEILRADDNLLEEEFHQKIQESKNQTPQTYQGFTDEEEENNQEPPPKNESLPSLWDDQENDGSFPLEAPQEEALETSLQHLEKNMPLGVLNSPIPEEFPESLDAPPENYEAEDQPNFETIPDGTDIEKDAWFDPWDEENNAQS